MAGLTVGILHIPQGESSRKSHLTEIRWRDVIIIFCQGSGIDGSDTKLGFLIVHSTVNNCLILNYYFKKLILQLLYIKLFATNIVVWFIGIRRYYFNQNKCFNFF